MCGQLQALYSTILATTMATQSERRKLRDSRGLIVYCIIAVASINEVLMTKNGDFAQSRAVYLKKSKYIYGEEEKGGRRFKFLGQ